MAFWVLECISVTIGLDEDREVVFYNVRQTDFLHNMAWMDWGEIQVLLRFLCSEGIWNMEDAAVGRYLFDNFALNKLRKKKRGFSFFLPICSSLSDRFACAVLSVLQENYKLFGERSLLKLGFIYGIFLYFS